MSLTDVASGALGGGIVGLATATSIAGLAERGRRRVIARHSMADTVSELRWAVLQGTILLGEGSSSQMRVCEHKWQAAVARLLVDQIRFLGRVQRSRVRRSLVRLFGAYIVEMAEELPPETDGHWSPKLAAAWTAWHPKLMERLASSPGSLHRAGEHPSEKGLWELAERDLDRLARAIG